MCWAKTWSFLEPTYFQFLLNHVILSPRLKQTFLLEVQFPDGTIISQCRRPVMKCGGRHHSSLSEQSSRIRRLQPRLSSVGIQLVLQGGCGWCWTMTLAGLCFIVYSHTLSAAIVRTVANMSLASRSSSSPSTRVSFIKSRTVVEVEEGEDAVLECGVRNTASHHTVSLGLVGFICWHQ